MAGDAFFIDWEAAVAKYFINTTFGQVKKACAYMIFNYLVNIIAYLIDEQGLLALHAYLLFHGGRRLKEMLKFWM